MNTPFTPRPLGRGFGFGWFGPEDRRALHEQRRQARREFRDHMREHRGDAGFGPGPGPASAPAVGSSPVSAPASASAGSAADAAAPPWQRPRTRPRGDVRAAILKLLADRPMHGYEMIQEIDERTQQLWKPSPGSVYPTLQLLVDEGLLVATESEGSKKLFELTDDGRAAAEKIETAPWEEITEGADPAP